MYRITFVLGGEKAYRDKAKRILLAAMTLVDKTYIEENVDAPDFRLLRYKDECDGEDNWLDASALVALGEGDCEDICCYVAGWLQAKRGINAWPQLVEKNGHTHVIVELPNGKQFDPTLAIGRVESATHECTGLGKDAIEEKITFVTDLFRIEDTFAGVEAYSQDTSHKSLRLMLHALLLIDIDWLRRHPETPKLYESGVRYEYEPPGREDWQDWPTTLRRKEGDCEDLANLRASELIMQGIPARPTFIWRMRPSGANLYHIQVTHPDGSVEDPSRRLGMGAAK